MIIDVLKSVVIKQLAEHGVVAGATSDSIEIDHVQYPFVDRPPIGQLFWHLGMDLYWPVPVHLLSFKPMDKWVLATSNLGKIKEYECFFPHLPIVVATHPESLNVIENKYTFYENALIKSTHAAKFEPKGSTVVADDSGFCLADVLWQDVPLKVQGAAGLFPGVFTKRFAKALCSDIDYKVAAKWLSDHFILPKAAYFECAIALTELSDGLMSSFLVQGQAHGQCVSYQGGANGFGFDPVFRPQGYNKTFSQMSEVEKGRISHRGMAIKSIKQQFDCMIKQ